MYLVIYSFTALANLGHIHHALTLLHISVYLDQLLNLVFLHVWPSTGGIWTETNSHQKLWERLQQATCNINSIVV